MVIVPSGMILWDKSMPNSIVASVSPLRNLVLLMDTSASVRLSALKVI